jgi:hypothetical protein
MNNWIFLSKEGKDEYVNMFAVGSGGRVINTDDFNYKDSEDPIVLRGILKHKIMKRCWLDGRDFYFMDTGYMGNNVNPLNPMGWKYYHRIVKNDLQHNDLIKRPDDRFRKLQIQLHNWKKGGKKILIAKPDEKPMKFYGLELDEWLKETIETIKKYTDRPVVVRERVKSRTERMVNNSLKEALDDDVHCLITFNSNSATEAVMYGYPAFTLSPSHAAAPVTSQDLSEIETPFYPDRSFVYDWACHLAYGQFHINELKDGSAWRILNGC